MDFYPAETINKIAEDIRNHFGYKEDDYFIDITKLAKDGGLDVVEVDFDDPEVSGTLTTKNKKQTISVSRSDCEERKRFTIAHEIAHVILHESSQNHVDYRQALKKYTTKAELTKEIQANMLAAALLMPTTLVKKTWEEVKDLDQLAELFKVSKAAAAVRLETLGLLT